MLAVGRRLQKRGVVVQWIDVRGVPGQPCSFYHGQIFAMYDCLLRARAAHIDWVAFQDVDECLMASAAFDDADVSLLGSAVHVATVSGPKDVITFGQRKASAAKQCSGDEAGEPPPDRAQLYEQLISVRLGLAATECKDNTADEIVEQPEHYAQVHGRKCLGAAGNRKFMVRTESMFAEEGKVRKLTVHTAEAHDARVFNFPPGDFWMNHWRGLLRVAPERAARCLEGESG